MHTRQQLPVQRCNLQLPLWYVHEAYLKDVKEENSQTILPRVDQLLLGDCKQHLQNQQHRGKAQQVSETMSQIQTGPRCILHCATDGRAKARQQTFTYSKYGILYRSLVFQQIRLVLLSGHNTTGLTCAKAKSSQPRSHQIMRDRHVYLDHCSLC